MLARTLGVFSNVVLDKLEFDSFIFKKLQIDVVLSTVAGQVMRSPKLFAYIYKGLSTLGCAGKLGRVIKLWALCGKDLFA